MLNIPDEVKRLCRNNNSSLESWRDMEIAFFNSGIDSLYPSNDLFPSENLYPADVGTPWLVLTSGQIAQESFTMNENLCSADDIVLGSCEAAKIEFTVRDMEEDILGREFALTLSIGAYKLAFGMYTVESAVRQADRRMKKITAYDRMLRFDIDVSDWYLAMYQTDTSVHTVKELRDGLCAYCGVPQQNTTLINDDLQVGKTIDPQTLKGRDVLQAICEINGCFGHMDRTGQLVYVKLQESGIYPSETLYPASDLYPVGSWEHVAEELQYYRSISYEDYLAEGIDRVQIRQEEGDVGATAGSGTNTYVIEGNFLTYGLGSAELTRLARSVVDAVGGRSYRPAKLETYAMPWVEAGDGIRAITTDTEIVTYVLSRTMRGIQAMMDTVEAKGSQARNEVSGGLQREILQLKGKTAVIVKSVEEVSATVSDLETNTSAQIKVLSDSIALETKRAQGQEVELAAAIKVTSEQIALKVSKGDICTQITAESANGGQIILSAPGALIINAGNTKLDASGKMTLSGAEFTDCVNTGTMGAEVISCVRLNAQGAITAGDEISTSGNMSCASLYAQYVYADNLDNSSDRRLKKSIRTIPEKEAVRIIKALRPVAYRFRKGNIPGVGFIAQEVEEIEGKLPLTGERGGYKTIRYLNFIPLLAAVAQKQQRDIERLWEAVNG